MKRFFATPENIAGGSIALDPSESRHLARVLRLAPGDPATAFDGAGREFECTVAVADARRSVLTIAGEVQPASPESPLRITLAACLLKGEKFDYVVQKAVELGVASIIPLTSARTESKPGGGEKRTDRWNRIALAAAKQCGRARLMPVGAPTAFDAFIDQVNGPVLFFSERDGGALPETPFGESVTIIVGSEGGWDDAEIDAVRRCGFPIVTLGGRVLRAETAAIALAVIVQHRFGDLR